MCVWCVEGTHVCVVCGEYRCVCVWCVEGIYMYIFLYVHTYLQVNNNIIIMCGHMSVVS